MKIAKYLFLLFVLLAFALFVFISTQPNNFSISETQTVNANKEQVFTYVNDLSSWKTWWNPYNGNKKTIKADSTIIEYNNNILEKQNAFVTDSIHFVIHDKDFNGNSVLIFKPLDTKKSEITWNIRGEMTFKTKIFSFFSGGIERFLEQNIRESIANINVELENNFLNYSIALNGFETKKGVQYLALSDSVYIDDFDLNRKVKFKQLGQFITKENLTISGDPFVIFKSRTSKSYTYLSCIPISSELDSIQLDSLLIKGNFEPYLALKTTLKGSYSYRKKAWQEGKKAIANSNYKENKEGGLYIEVYKKESKQMPANNITEIYIPVHKPIIVNEPKKDSLQPTETIQDSI